MTNFRRLAEIEVRLNTTQADIAIRRHQATLARASQLEIQRLKKGLAQADLTAKQRIALTRKIAREEIALVKLVESHRIGNEVKIRASMARVARENQAHNRKRIAQRARALRHIATLEKRQAMKERAIAAKKNRDIMAMDRMRGRGRAGISPVAGVGPTGSFGFLMGGGAVGGAIMGGMALHEGISKSVSTFMEQEMAVARVMSLVNEEEQKAGFSLQFARRQAQNLAMELGISIPEAAMAMREAITTAVAPIRAGDFLKAAHGLALMEGADPKAITGMLASIRNAYDLTRAEMAALPDLIFTSIDEGHVKVDKIRTLLGDVGGIARAAGINLRELMGAFSALTRGGMSEARAMTSIRAFAELMQKRVPKSVAEDRKRAGLDLSPDRMRAIGFLKVMDEIREASDKTGISIARLLGGKARALKGIIQLTSTLRDDMAEIMDRQLENVGRAAAEHDKLMNSAPMKMERVKSAIEVGFADIGEGMVTAFGKVFGGGKDFDQTVKSINRSFKQAAVTIEPIVGGMLIMGKMAFQIGDKVSDLNPILNLLKAGTGEYIDQQERINALLGDDLKVLENFKEVQEERNALEKVFQDQVEDVNLRLQGKMQDLLKTEIDLSANMVKTYKKGYTEREKFLKQQMSREKGVLTKAANEAKKLEKSRVDFILKQSLRLEKAKMDATGANDIERAVRAHRRYNQFTGLAANAKEKGDTALAQKYNAQAMGAAEQLSGMDMSAISASTYEQVQDAIAGIAGVSRGDNPLERMRKRKNARNLVNDFMRQRRREQRKGQFDFMNRIEPGKRFGLGLQEKAKTQGEDILATGRDTALATAAQHITIYDTLGSQLQMMHDVWKNIRIEAEAVAKAAEDMSLRLPFMSGNEALAARNKMQGRRLSLTERLQGLTGTIEERTRTPEGSVEDPIAESRNVVYHVNNSFDFHGITDPKEVAKAVKAAMDRGVENPDANK